MKGIVYLVQPAELVGTNRYKIGCSNQGDLRRLTGGYKKGTRYIEIRETPVPFLVEKMVKERFSQTFELIAGAEYFQGHEGNMRGLFQHTTNECGTSEKFGVQEGVMQFLSELTSTILGQSHISAGSLTSSFAPIGKQPCKVSLHTSKCEIDSKRDSRLEDKNKNCFQKNLNEQMPVGHPNIKVGTSSTSQDKRSDLCTNCNCRFTKLKDHMKVCKGPLENRYRCGLCWKKCAHSSDLTRHMKTCKKKAMPNELEQLKKENDELKKHIQNPMFHVWKSNPLLCERKLLHNIKS